MSRQIPIKFQEPFIWVKLKTSAFDPILLDFQALFSLLKDVATSLQNQIDIIVGLGKNPRNHFLVRFFYQFLIVAYLIRLLRNECRKKKMREKRYGYGEK